VKRVKNLDAEKDILNEIVRTRRQRIAEKGYAAGLKLPDKRTVPLVRVPEKRFLIAEIKKASPSKGVFREDFDHLKLAAEYAENKAEVLSVLTEEDYFKGSLAFLMEIKKKMPQLCILRKDFLLEREDIDVSYRAGADMVLLIASILEEKKLAELYEYAVKLGMEVLVEVHTEDELQKAARFKPAFTGFNSRDLKTFRTDLLLPVRLCSKINWKTRTVFESGIKNYEDARFAVSAGFEAVLAGEALVKHPDTAAQIIRALEEKPYGAFWKKLFSKPGAGPFVKICGLTEKQDVLMAEKLRADILGFVFAESPRRTDALFLRQLEDVKTLKTAVLTEKELADGTMESIYRLAEDGLVDAVQLHGKAVPDIPFYNALSIKDKTRLDNPPLSPRFLIDAYKDGQAGGTGKKLDDEICAAAAEKYPLWLAGGLKPSNIAETVKAFRPELVDASSGLEESPGRKSEELMKEYFRELGR
jgi:indole-3-glycerol phosphate synthase/phosphoribosylanthranilate isomerase